MSTSQGTSMAQAQVSTINQQEEEEDYFSVAADFTLYSNPLVRALHRPTPKDTSNGTKSESKSTTASSTTSDNKSHKPEDLGDDIIASDMTAYDSPLAMLDKETCDREHGEVDPVALQKDDAKNFRNVIKRNTSGVTITTTSDVTITTTSDVTTTDISDVSSGQSTKDGLTKEKGASAATTTNQIITGSHVGTGVSNAMTSSAQTGTGDLIRESSRKKHQATGLKGILKNPIEYPKISNNHK